MKIHKLYLSYLFNRINSFYIFANQDEVRLLEN